MILSKHIESKRELWERINQFEFDDLDSEFTFSQRLARENNWTLEFTLRVLFEYKRFIYLICVSDQPMTPSDSVDQAWHLHLLYTQSYWISFCKETLGRDIHHGPTKGGKQEKEKHRDYYIRTKKKYQEVFSEPPPEDIWPSEEIRFSEIRFARINLHRNWVIPKLKRKRL